MSHQTCKCLECSQEIKKVNSVKLYENIVMSKPRADILDVLADFENKGLTCIACAYLVEKIRPRTDDLGPGKLFEWLQERADDDGSIEHCESVNSIEHGCIARFYERFNKNGRVKND